MNQIKRLLDLAGGIRFAFAGLTLLLLLAAVDGPLEMRGDPIPTTWWVLSLVSLALGMAILVRLKSIIAFDSAVAVLVAALVANGALWVVDGGRLDCVLEPPPATEESRVTVAIPRRLIVNPETPAGGSATMTITTRQRKANGEQALETKTFDTDVVGEETAEDSEEALLLVSVKRGEHDADLTAVLTALEMAQRVEVFAVSPSSDPPSEASCFWES